MTTSLSALVVRDLNVNYAGRAVLTDVDLTAQPGRRIGLVGENGVGKSTLLHAIAGALPARAHLSGTVEVPGEVTLVGQEPPFEPSDTVAEVLSSTLRPLRDAVADVERLAASLPDEQEAYASTLEWALAHEAWDADRRAEAAARHLGLGTVARGRRVGSLSGGQRTRLAMAAAMTTRPSCLLLDEPTNHLDDRAAGVLADFLVGLPGVVLFASHDRAFLDDVATDLVDLDPSGSTHGRGARRFGGGWSAYERHRRAARRRWEETWAAQQEELDRLRRATRIDTNAVAHDRVPRDNDGFIYSFKGGRVDRTVARRKKQAERALTAAERGQLPKPPQPLRLSADLTTAGNGSLVRVRDLVVADRLRLDHVDLAAGEHLLVSGGNGSGKTTLLGVLSGRVAPTAGYVQVAARRVAELRQDVTFADASATAAATYRRVVGEEANRRPLAALGLLRARDLRTPVGQLSVGQRRRLGLALAIARRPDLLLLDEPTNHISLSLAGELEEALATSPGAVVVASHDRWLRDRWAGPSIVLSQVDTDRAQFPA